MPTLPLEIKTLIIGELYPYASVFSPSYVGMTKDEYAATDAAYFRDLCTVCLVWPDTMAVIRKIIFKMISISLSNRRIDASLRSLCEALENDPGLSTFVKILEFSHRNPIGLSRLNAPFIPTASRPLFHSFLSFVPKMHELVILRFDNIHFTSIEFLDDLRILKESSVQHLDLGNSTFPISAFNAFLSYWEDMELSIRIDSIIIIPSTLHASDRFQIEDTQWDWDEEDSWTEWEIDKPRTARFLSVSELHLNFSEPHGYRWGMLTLMDLLASNKWSPLKDIDILEVSAEGSVMTTATVTRINTLIRRFEITALWLDDFTKFDEAIHTPLYLGGVKSVEMAFGIGEDFVLSELDKIRFDWSGESLAAVAPDSRLRELTLRLTTLDPLEPRDFGSRGVWGVLDSVLCRDNLQLDALTIEVRITPPPNGAGTARLVQFHTWLKKVCFPAVTAKYFECNTEGREMSALTLWVGDEQYCPKKH